jgi:hypothetical protein
MTEDELQAAVTTLQQQQAMFTQALCAALAGRWTGEGSVEAHLYALDPDLFGTLDVDAPVVQSEL